MTPELWRRVCAALDALAPLPAEQQASDLQRLRQSDPVVAGEVESLLRQQASSEPFALEGAVTAALRRLEPPGESDGAEEAVNLPSEVGRYLVVEELGRGGMGVVYRVRDPLFRRSLAVKVLAEEHAGNADLKRRFLEEARLMAQLQHPGIPPVHDLGELPDGRPYFALKLIRGRTLGDILEGRAAPGGDLPRLLGIFEQVCQTLAYAHKQGVLHRDLKPGNVMVGAFGEVQVMDWGLSKILPPGEKPVPAEAGAGPVSAICPARTETPHAATLPGRILGTPAYMAPEQAEGQNEAIDRRTDVYGLGAVLYHILTGRAPVSGRGLSDLLKQVRDGAILAPRKAAAGVPRPLEAVCLKALARERVDRYQTAQELAEEVNRWVLGEPVRAHPEPWLNRAVRWGRRHRTAVTGVLAALLMALLLGGSGWAWWRHDRAGRLAEQTRKSQERRAEIQAEAERAEKLLKRAGGVPREEWGPLIQEGLAAAEKAYRLLEKEDLEDAAGSRAREVLEALRDQERDRKMLERLEFARLSGTAVRDNHFDGDRTAEKYEQAFAEYGLDLGQANLEEAAGRLRARSIRVELAAALDDWARYRAEADANRLRQLTRQVDDDPERCQIREAIARGDVALLRRLAAPGKSALPAATAVLLARALQAQKLYDETDVLLKEAWQRSPRDFWINHERGWLALSRSPPQPGEAARHYAVAVAVGPGSPGAWVNFGGALEQEKRAEEAIFAYRRATELDRGYPVAFANLSSALVAAKRFEEAIPVQRRLTELEPGNPEHFTGLGWVLSECKQFEEAVGAYRRGTELGRRDASAFDGLGWALHQTNRVEEAIAAYRQAIAANPNYARAFVNLGDAYAAQKKWAEATTAYRTATERDPGSDLAFERLGQALQAKQPAQAALAFAGRGAALNGSQRYDEAILALKKAIELDDRCARAFALLGAAQGGKGEWDEAEAAYRKAASLDRKDARAFQGLGWVLIQKKWYANAAVELKKATELDPEGASAFVHLGQALVELKRWDDAIATLKKATALAPSESSAFYNLGLSYEALEKWDEAAATYNIATLLAPGDADTFLKLGLALIQKKAFGAAVPVLQRATELNKTNAEAFNSLGYALEELKRFDEALAALEEAKRLNPEDVLVLRRIGFAHAGNKNWKEAIAAYGKAAALAPNDAEVRDLLGDAHAGAEDWDSAIAAYRKATTLDPKYAVAFHDLGTALIQKGRFEEAIAALRAASGLPPKDREAKVFYDLGYACSERGLWKEAADAFRKVVEIDPADLEGTSALAQVLLNQGKLSEACECWKRYRERLGPEDPRREEGAGRQRAVERLIDLERRLPAILGEEAKVAEGDRLACAELCRYKEQLLASARFYRSAFAARPELAEDIQADTRYNAACVAARAGAGQGLGADKLSEEERTRWRRQALRWLREDLAAWGRALEGGAKDAARLRDKVGHWQIDGDLSPVRDPKSLAELPADERRGWVEFWAEVKGLLARASSAAKKK